MDKLASEGVQFMNHYNTTSICMASRATLLTGMYEYKTGCNFMHGPLHPLKFQQSYPVILRNAGYFTGFAGKFGMAVTDSPSEKETSWDVMPIDAFDEWAGGTGQTFYKTAQNKYIEKYAKDYPHSTRAYGAWANDFMKDAKKSGKPFCMSISFKAPHMPFTPDPFFDSVYEGTTYIKPANYGVENAAHLSPQSKTGRQFKAYRFWVDSEESYQETIKKYNQLVYGVDYAIGMIRKSLEEQGFDKNTVIILTGDNGYNCGAHGFGDKIFPYEEGSKSPMIIFDPRAKPNQKGIKREIVTANIDVAPTILSYAGIQIPSYMDGKNLRQLIDEPNKFDRQTIPLFNMWGNDEIQEMSIVSKDWKYIFWQYADERMRPTEELFNVANDRIEMKNRINDPTAGKVLKQMRKIYDKQVSHIDKNAVDYNDYHKYSVLFDRKTTADKKKPYLTGTFENIKNGGE